MIHSFPLSNVNLNKTDCLKFILWSKMSNSASISALSEWDRPGNDQTLAKLTEKQCVVLTEIETFMEGRRTFKEVRNISSLLPFF